MQDLTPDAVPDELAGGTPEPLRGELRRLLGDERVLDRVIDLVAYASDASPYRLLPRAVVMAHDAGDVARVLEYGRGTGTPVTLRAGGTSLSGQAQSDGILVDVRRHFRGVAVEEDGAVVRVKPGTVLGHVNRVLAPLGRRLGPDPASTEIACVGGVIANNSGGMRCGVVADPYSTVRSMTLVLPSGTVVDTAADGAAESLAAAEPELTRGLAEIRDEIRADAELAERIRRKFAIKNTMGYRLCAFLDADEPLEILRRLVVGSEGTLAFVAEAVFETVPVPSRTAVSWLHFAGIDQACEPVPELVAAGATAVELMVAPALMVASRHIRGAPADWMELPPDSAALLVEFGAESEAELDKLVAGAEGVLSARELIRPPDFTGDEERIEVAWKVREGLHGLIGRLRPPGTALIIEDVCVAPERIAEAASEIQALLGEHGFLTGVAGHASAGNLHFMLTPDFSKPEDLDRYRAFMEKLADLIVERYDGSLKAEHGTGRNMAPYLEREWGPKATGLMRRIKRLADPDGVLAPGVILSDDPGIHLRHLKTTPRIEEVADTCVECGFCEPVCPSRLLTTTPRQRIVIRREIARQPSGSPVQRALLEQFQYDGIDTCAADGSCALVCPLAIDTGELVKELRARERPKRARRAALRQAKRWASVERAARAGLRAGGALSRVGGGGVVRGLSRAAGRALGGELMPSWGGEMPAAAGPLPPTERAGATALYFPACVNRVMGPPRTSAPGLPDLPQAMVALSARAGLPLWIPPDVAGHCCAVPWSSKGYPDAHVWMANRTVEALWRWSGEGELPVVVDASSCTHGLADEVTGALTEANAKRHARLSILDSVVWARRHLLSALGPPRRVGSVAVHPTCSTRRLDLARELEALAGELAEEVVVPPSATCCGFAGDRGFLRPELTMAATAEQATELGDRQFDAYVSTNRTCELGLTRATGQPYASVLYLLEELTRP